MINFNGANCSNPKLPSNIRSKIQGTYFSNKTFSCSLSCLFSINKNLLQYGVYPKFLGSTYTIPALETVAGEAYLRSPT